MQFARKKNRGLATMLVLVVVALASLIGMAMLSSSALQQEVADSASRAAASDYLAESAVQASAFYLQNPAKLPANWVHTGYALYTRGATITGVNGSFDADASVTSKPDYYQINAVGYSGTTAAPTRKESALIQVIRAKPLVAGEFGSGLNIPKGYTVTGPILANGTVTQSVGATVNGTISSVFKSTDFVVPTSGTINYYGGNNVGGTYTMADGTTGTPQAIAAGSTLTVAPVANANNPGKVFYCAGSLTITPTSAFTIAGTLVVRGSLTVTASSAVAITIAPVSGFPALVADTKLQINGKNIALTLNGVVWLGTGTSGTNCTGSVLVINGALVMPASATLTVPALNSYTANINYIAANSNVNNMTISTSPQPVTGIKFQSWTQ